MALMARLRAYLSAFLVLVLVLTGHSMAIARGMPGAAGYAAVGEVLEGRSDAVAELRQPAGALVIFQGSTTLHRVTPVHGAEPRLVVVFSYSPEPGAEVSVHDRKTFYGRVA